MKLVIPCAGQGTRMGTDTPKCLVEVNGKSIVERIIGQWKGIADSFVVVVNPDNAQAIKEHIAQSAEVTYVVQTQQLGLADAILRAEMCVGEKFVVQLGDCLFEGSLKGGDFGLGIGAWKTFNNWETLKNYGVRMRPFGRGRDVVWTLWENPKLGEDVDACGMGLYFLDRRVFDYIRQFHGERGGGDFTEVLRNMVEAGEEIRPVWLFGNYININTQEDLVRAERMFA